MEAHRERTRVTGRLVGALAGLVAVAAMTSCGADGGDDGSAGAIRTAPNGDAFNDADVDFATSMIQHHAQALVMVDMTLGRRLDPAVQQLAEDVRATQTPEIETMVDWLTAWDEPIPETARDHANAHGDGHGGPDHGDLPGMMSAEEMGELEAADDAEFEELFLEMMIEHHQGAIEMARTQQDAGAFGPAVELAGQVEAGQEQEIETMQALLGS